MGIGSAGIIVLDALLVDRVDLHRIRLNWRVLVAGAPREFAVTERPQVLLVVDAVASRPVQVRKRLLVLQRVAHVDVGVVVPFGFHNSTRALEVVSGVVAFVEFPVRFLRHGRRFFGARCPLGETLLMRRRTFASLVIGRRGLPALFAVPVPAPLQLAPVLDQLVQEHPLPLVGYHFDGVTPLQRFGHLLLRDEELRVGSYRAPGVPRVGLDDAAFLGARHHRLRLLHHDSVLAVDLVVDGVRTEAEETRAAAVAVDAGEQHDLQDLLEGLVPDEIRGHLTFGFVAAVAKPPALAVDKYWRRRQVVAAHATREVVEKLFR